MKLPAVLLFAVVLVWHSTAADTQDDCTRRGRDNPATRPPVDPDEANGPRECSTKWYHWTWSRKSHKDCKDGVLRWHESGRKCQCSKGTENHWGNTFQLGTGCTNQVDDQSSLQTSLGSSVNVEAVLIPAVICAVLLAVVVLVARRSRNKQAPQDLYQEMKEEGPLETQC
eukprot:NODE_1027_length_707_cov_411.173252_g701_i0.p1 GENE.NODE_1027_length_707_cov_411.173252_g701_i0~~NODE_1027_length_707_cov_411.173252_g701_i0.p1  ORF type:complete len:170 (-),score=37.97 NODE_1027_length_707_cov_411.173252_g701_i0:122-631(-)